MQRLFKLDEFAELVDLSTDEVEEARDLGLVDPDRDELFDEYDVLRLWHVLIFRRDGKSFTEVADGIRDGTLEIPFFGEFLFNQSGRSYSFGEAAGRAGITEEQAEELSTAVGIPPSGFVSDVDVEALRSAKILHDLGIPWEAVLEVGRVYGDAFRRIATTEVRLMDQYITEPLHDQGMDQKDVSLSLHRALGVANPLASPLFDYFHRRHLARESARHVLAFLQGRAPRRGSFDAAIVFIDLSSFTAVAQAHGDHTAADVLDRFDTLVRSSILDYSGSLIKQIGDAFMLTFDDASDAVRFALDQAEAAEREEHFLATRTGIHWGPVLYRMGDYVGNTVNIASRLAAEAMPNEILVTEPVATAADRAGIGAGKAGVRMLRGSAEPLELFRITRPEAPSLRQDPVCGMMVGSEAPARLTRDGEELLFCSEECLSSFLANPVRRASR